MPKELIMIAGPYSSETKTEEEREHNLEVLNRAALKVFERGRIPIIGVNNAIPLVKLAGEGRFNEIMMPLSLALAERCDSCLRVGGKSKGADEEVEIFKHAGKNVYYDISEIYTVR